MRLLGPFHRHFSESLQNAVICSWELYPLLENSARVRTTLGVGSAPCGTAELGASVSWWSVKNKFFLWSGPGGWYFRGR